MAQSGQRTCLCCGDYFDFDYRNRGRQRYCSNLDCRRTSKAASQAAWLAKPQNVGYFCDPVHVSRVQAWRLAHPGYSHGKADPPAALQDPLTALAPALAGLIAHLFELTLQEDMASTTRRLVQLGHDVINRGRGEDSQTSLATAAAAPGAGAVQLD